MKSGLFVTVDADEVQPLLEKLRQSGFSDSSVSVLIPHARKTRGLGLSQDVRHGAVTGGIVGAVAAELGAVATLVLAGVGPALVAGPLLLALGGAAISGAAVGGAIGGLAGGTGNLAALVGIPHSVAVHYEDELRSGRGLIMAEYDGPDERERLRRLFLDSAAGPVHDTATSHARS
jgi:hypothetical protein